MLPAMDLNVGKNQNACVDLREVFDQLNLRWFEGFLDAPVLVWNTRLRSSAGRFFPGSRRLFRIHPPKIEIASYLMTEDQASVLIADTMAHEMIHYWLWVRKRPYGHTGEFLAKMRSMGVSRYNTVPKLRLPKWEYECPECKKTFQTRRKLGTLACLHCCKQHTQGRYDSRFRLSLSRALR